MLDIEIREKLKQSILARSGKRGGMLLLEEFDIGLRSSRVDLLLVNGKLHGFEIKSDHDTLGRLPRQIGAYSSVFDYITLIVGYRHAYEALHIIPNWWGVKLATFDTRGRVTLSSARRARANPIVDPVALSSLLWRNEALALLHELNAARGLHHKPRAVLYRHLAEVAPVESIHTRVIRQLKVRQDSQAGEEQR